MTSVVTSLPLLLECTTVPRCSRSSIAVVKVATGTRSTSCES